jgi:hypothetical protein
MDINKAKAMRAIIDETKKTALNFASALNDSKIAFFDAMTAKEGEAVDYENGLIDLTNFMGLLEEQIEELKKAIEPYIN